MCRIMKYFLFYFLLTTNIYATEQYAIGPFVDYLRHTPANAGGQITAMQTKTVSSSGLSWVNINKDKPIYFGFDENKLTLNSSGGITIKVMGVAVWVKSINIDKNGRFVAKTSTPLGIFQGSMDKKVSAELEKLFKPKMQAAFRALQGMRSKRSITDANQTIQHIVNVFTSGPGSNAVTLPDFRGSLSLNFTPPADRSVGIGYATMDIDKGELLQAGIDFEVGQRKKFSITGMNMNAPDGVRFRPSSTKGRNTIATVNLRSVCLGTSCPPGSGKMFDVDYISGPEEAATGVAILAGLILAQSGELGRADICKDEVKIDFIRNVINRRVNGEMSRLVKENYKELIAAGVEPRILKIFLK